MDLKQMREKYIKEGYEIFVSTRYKDIFDFYYLINNENLNKNKLLKCFDILIFQDETMKENSVSSSSS